jgi:hypothetical protein
MRQTGLIITAKRAELDNDGEVGRRMGAKELGSVFLSAFHSSAPILLPTSG